MTRLKIVKLFLVLIVVLLACSGTAVAEDKAAETAPTEFVVPGLLAGQGNFQGSVAIDTASNKPLLTDKPNIISGSFSRGERGDCTVAVKNTSSENTYSIHYEVRERGRNNRVRVIASRRPTLAPGASDERTVRCEAKSAVGVFLLSGEQKNS